MRLLVNCGRLYVKHEKVRSKFIRKRATCEFARGVADPLPIPTRLLHLAPRVLEKYHGVCEKGFASALPATGKGNP